LIGDTVKTSHSRVCNPTPNFSSFGNRDTDPENLRTFCLSADCWGGDLWLLVFQNIRNMWVPSILPGEKKEQKECCE
jgi:hypothetical protein